MEIFIILLVCLVTIILIVRETKTKKKSNNKKGSKNCQICGANSGMYPLCKDCMKLKEQGLVIKNENTGLWELKKEEKRETNQERNCIICGQESNNMLFCKSCYYKYRNREILLKIKNCKEIELLDITSYGKYICEDGHRVKSKSEREIDNYLFNNNIKHAYEKRLPIDEKESHDIRPDFTLPDYDSGNPVYIEHWGFGEENEEYTKSKNFKLDIYKKMGLTIIQTNEKDLLTDTSTTIRRKLTYYKSGEIN